MRSPKVSNNDRFSNDNACFVNIEILDTNVLMLVDTGSSVTILQKRLFERLPLNERPEVKPVNITLTTATGDTFPFLGKVKLTFKLGKQTFQHDVLLADIKNDGIIGMDFFQSYNCQIDLKNQCLKIVKNL